MISSGAGRRERWESGSKVRTDSISSPKKSTRTGSGAPGAKMSTMPPRWANSPGRSTSGVGSYPKLTRRRVNASRSVTAPGASVR